MKHFSFPRSHKFSVEGASLKLAAGILSLALVFSSAPNSEAALIAAEDFTYASGALSNPANNGGVGWSGAWGGSNVPTVLSTSNLSYTATGYGIVQSGTGQINAFYSTGDGLSTRALSEAIEGSESGTEVWFSLLLRANGSSASDAGRTGLFFNVDDTSRSSADGGFLLVGNGFRLLSGGVLGADSATLALNATHLVVGKISLTLGSSAISLWLDPSNVTNLDALGTASLTYNADFGGSIFNVGIQAYGQGTLAAVGMSDALRIGTTLSSVTTPVPEPSVLLLSLGGVLLLGGMRHRSRRLQSLAASGSRKS